MFKCIRFIKFKKELKDEKIQIFSKMRQSQNLDEWKELREKYHTYDQMDHPHGRISMETLISIMANLSMLSLVLYFEKVDIITSKIFNWIKPRKF